LIKVRNETRQNLTQVRIVVLTGLATEKWPSTLQWNLWNIVVRGTH
jgi:hypothetical protein